MIWSGVSLAFIDKVFVDLMTTAMQNSTEDYPKISQDEDLKDKLAFKAMTLMGVGQVVGGIFIGWFRDLAGN